MFADYNNKWEYDDFTDKYEQLIESLDKNLQKYNSDNRRTKID